MVFNNLYKIGCGLLYCQFLSKTSENNPILYFFCCCNVLIYNTLKKSFCQVVYYSYLWSK